MIAPRNGSKKPQNEEYSSVLRSILCILVAYSLVFVTSCRRKSEDQSSLHSVKVSTIKDKIREQGQKFGHGKGIDNIVSSIGKVSQNVSIYASYGTEKIYKLNSSFLNDIDKDLIHNSKTKNPISRLYVQPKDNKWNSILAFKLNHKRSHKAQPMIVIQSLKLKTNGPFSESLSLDHFSAHQLRVIDGQPVTLGTTSKDKSKIRKSASAMSQKIKSFLNSRFSPAKKKQGFGLTDDKVDVRSIIGGIIGLTAVIIAVVFIYVSLIVMVIIQAGLLAAIPAAILLAFLGFLAFMHP